MNPIATKLPTLHRLELNHCTASSLSLGALAPHEFFKLEILVFSRPPFAHASPLPHMICHHQSSILHLYSSVQYV